MKKLAAILLPLLLMLVMCEAVGAVGLIVGALISHVPILTLLGALVGVAPSVFQFFLGLKFGLVGILVVL